MLFSVVAAPLYRPIRRTDSLFSTTSPTLMCCLDNSHSDRCEVRSHCDFNFHFPD